MKRRRRRFSQAANGGLAKAVRTTRLRQSFLQSRGCEVAWGLLRLARPWQKTDAGFTGRRGWDTRLSAARCGAGYSDLGKQAGPLRFGASGTVDLWAGPLAPNSEWGESYLPGSGNGSVRT